MKGEMRKMKKIFSVLLCFALTFTVLPAAVSAEKVEGGYLLENDRFSFLLNEEYATFTVTDKQSGNVYHSNPAAREGVNNENLYSQLSVTYFSDKSERTTLNSYDHSTVYGNTVITEEKDKIRVDYTFGKQVIDKTMIPTAFTEKDFEDILKKEGVDEKMFRQRYKLKSADDDTDGTLIKDYPLLGEESLYILHQYTPDYDVENIYKQLKNVGFGHDELVEHNEKYGIKVEYTESIFVSVPVEYSLTDSGFSANIDCDKVETGGDIYLTNIDLLPFYEAAFPDEEGYILLPDGSGALINFNNSHLTLNNVSVPIYGNDNALSISQKITYDERATLPVFGISRGERGSLMIIEDGDATASVYADISGRVGMVATAFAGFNILPYERVTLTSVSSKTSYNIYGPESYKGDITVRFVLLSGNSSDYVGMAAAYRKYLTDGGLLSTADSAEYPLSVEFLGGISKKKSFLGFTYTKDYALTTFSDAVAIANSLKASAIDDILLKYDGWADGGLTQEYAEKLSPLKVLGGQKGLETFKKTLNNLGITCYFDASLQTINHNLVNSKVNVFSSGTKFVYKDIAQHSLYHLATMYPLDEKMFGTTPNNPVFYLLSPGKLPALWQKVQKNSQKLGGMNYNYADIGSMLYSDFDAKESTSRQESLESIKELLSDSQGYSVSGGDIYTLSGAEHIFSISDRSSRKLIYDREVPFTQMVLHGLVSYSGSAINLSDDPTEALLKTVETGALMHYTFAAQNISELKNSDHNKYYSVSFDAWKQNAIENYHKVASFARKTALLPITNHEYLSDTVTATTYEGGYVAVVNYGDEAFTFRGQTVGPRDFACFE